MKNKMMKKDYGGYNYNIKTICGDLPIKEMEGINLNHPKNSITEKF